MAAGKSGGSAGEVTFLEGMLVSPLLPLPREGGGGKFATLGAPRAATLSGVRPRWA